MDEGLAAVRRRKALLSILYMDKSFTIAGRGFDISEAYRLLSFFERAFRGDDAGLSFGTEDDAVDRLRQGEVQAVIALPPIRKSEVVTAARRGELFPIKSSRHIIRSRPIGIDIPLAWLKERPESLAPRLESKLSSGHFKALPQGTIINGRRYEEEIYIFEPSSFGGDYRGGGERQGKVPSGPKRALRRT
jgi:hypothetical protein